MSTSYSLNINNFKTREPLFKRVRSYYRSPRKSYQENLIANQIYIDIQRIYLELEKINLNILNDIKIILDKEKDNDFTDLNTDGSRSYSLDSTIVDPMTFHVKWKSAASYTTVEKMDTMDTLSSRLSRVNYKLNRIEKNG